LTSNELCVSGTDEELETRLRHFDDHINSQKQKKRHEDTRKQDFEDQLANVRERHNELLARQGALTAEANVRKDVVVRGLCIISFFRHKASA
jgi:DNA repair protein RAD50